MSKSRKDLTEKMRLKSINFSCDSKLNSITKLIDSIDLCRFESLNFHLPGNEYIRSVRTIDSDSYNQEDQRGSSRQSSNPKMSDMN